MSTTYKAVDKGVLGGGGGGGGGGGRGGGGGEYFSCARGVQHIALAHTPHNTPPPPTHTHTPHKKKN